MERDGRSYTTTEDKETGLVLGIGLGFSEKCIWDKDNKKIYSDTTPYRTGEPGFNSTSWAISEGQKILKTYVEKYKKVGA